MNILFWLKDKGYFQVKYLNDTSYMIIKNNDSSQVLNSETHIFKFNCKDSKKLKLFIYLSENNFIDNHLQNLDIK